MAGIAPCPDCIGIRPAMLAVGERLATMGYLVLLPDLFYRSGPYAPMNAKTVFSDPEQRRVLLEKYLSLVTPSNVMSDTAALLEYLGIGQADLFPEVHQRTRSPMLFGGTPSRS